MITKKKFYKIFDKIIYILLSRKFAVYLLIITVTFLTLGTLFPNINSMSPEEIDIFRLNKPLIFKITNILNIQKLISSPYFLILPILIFISIFLCTIKRLKIGSRKEGGFFYEVSSRTVIQLEDIKSMLSSEKWSITEEDNHLVAKKGKAGFWGSLLFHLGLLIVFIAGVISSLTRFNAELLLTEGFPVMLREESFVKIYKNNSILSIPPSIIELKKFIPLYEKGIYAKDFSAKISIDGVERELRVNRPIDIGGFQLSLHRFGFSPYFRITENNGKELLNANINLVVIGGKEDSFTIPDTFYVIYTKFFPDFFSKNGRVGSRGIVPKNPVFFLRIFYDNKELGRGMVKLGSTITIDELNISFKDLNYWVDLIVSKDYGVWLFSIGLAIGIFGLIMRFILPDKQLKINVVGNRVYIKGWTKYFPSFFEDEINKVLEKISN